MNDETEIELNDFAEGIAEDWKRAHFHLRRLAKERAAQDLEIGRWMLVALRNDVHARIGFATFAEYIERILGFDGRMAYERLRVAENLGVLPETSAALGHGAISWSAARELTRVATEETESAWLKAAAGRTVHEVEQLVSGRCRGDLPDGAKLPGLERRVLKIELTAATLATFREAMAKARRDAGGHLDDDAVMLAMARQVLGGPTDEGRASYQIAITQCPDCGRAAQQSRGESIEVGEEVVETAECDAQHVHVSTLGGEKRSPASQRIPPAIRREVVRRDHGRCVVPGCRNATFLDVHHARLRSEGGDHDPEFLLTLCGAHHALTHKGQLIIEGRCSTGFVFKHADGTKYGNELVPERAEVMRDAFSGLRNLGFGETQTKLALQRAMTRVGQACSLENLLRAALTELRT
jgi:hypothetical protein